MFDMDLKSNSWEMLGWRPFIGVLFLALIACSSLGNPFRRADPVVQGPWAAEIGPEGGSIQATAGNLILEVPAGALAEPTTIQVDIAQPQNSADLIGYELRPDGLSFQLPVTISISYAELLPDEAEPSSLVLIHASEQGEEPLSQQAIDHETREISGTIEHFSWIFLRLLDDDGTGLQLSGIEQLEKQDDVSSARYEVVLTYSPESDTWELFTTVGQEAGGGVYQLSAEGNITIENQAGLTEGSLPLSGECLFATGDSPSIAGFEGIGVPFQILSSEDPEEGETATVVMNPESQELYAFDGQDSQACPVFGPRQVFEIVLTENIAPVPLNDE